MDPVPSELAAADRLEPRMRTRTGARRGGGGGCLKGS